jgi:hypothetical protein
MWLTSDEPAPPGIAKTMLTPSLDYRIAGRTLTDISDSVKLVVCKNANGRLKGARSRVDEKNCR